jgi:hypothetical protein
MAISILHNAGQRIWPFHKPASITMPEIVENPEMPALDRPEKLLKGGTDAALPNPFKPTTSV